MAVELKTSQPKWSILILTQPTRTVFLSRLLSVLQPQVNRALGVEIKIKMFNPLASLGTNRHVMREEAGGEYSCFIDDDDLVPDDYVSSILPLLDGVDYVGFQLQCYIDGDAMKQMTFHSLKYDGWNSDADGHYRDISHVNPIKNSLALQAIMSGGMGEDARWSDELKKLGIVKTEHYIPRTMYHYYFRSLKEDDIGGRKYTQSGTPSIVMQNGPAAVCPKCKALCTTLYSNGRRCNQCGTTW